MISTPPAPAAVTLNVKESLGMIYTDDLGSDVATTSAEAFAAFEQGVEALLYWRSGALEEAVALDVDLSPLRPS